MHDTRTPAGAPASRDGGQRLVSLDAFRGFTMLFLATSGLGFAKIAASRPDSPLWKFLGHHFSHVRWQGGGAWDMIQPAFMFMVGMAVPYAVSRRLAEGATVGRLILQALCRSLVLVGLGIFLVTGSKKQPDFLFVNVLAQIGLGYVFLLPLVGRSARVQVAAMAALGIACWAAFATHPLPVPGLDLGSLGITPNLAEDVVLPGFFGHWSMNTNFAADFDRWFLNLFPRETPFAFEAGGYQTLNFVPSIITMILGLMAAERLRGPGGGYDHLRWLVAMGAGCLALGLLAGATVCPIVKRIWTPSWALASGGVCLWLVALFYWLIDIRGWRGWAWPLVVVGMNSIAFYLAYQLLRDWIKARAATYLGSGMFAGTFGPVWQNLIVLGVLWLWCWWLYRRQIFLRV